jgi:hypothetical protein
MQLSTHEVMRWLLAGQRRQDILMTFTQPLTATHLATKLGLSRNTCPHGHWELHVYQLVTCLNPDARMSRVYWLTPLGRECQRRLLARHQQQLEHYFPEMDWKLYGWTCYAHRSAVIKALERPLRPRDIKHHALVNDPALRMSASNLRDTTRALRRHGIIDVVYLKGRKYTRHHRYRLTSLGRNLRELLIRATSR